MILDTMVAQPRMAPPMSTPMPAVGDMHPITIDKVTTA